MDEDVRVGFADVAGVVPVFRPTDDVFANLLALRSQVGSLYVVDDGSDSKYDAVLDRIERLEGMTLLRMKENSGIATALNAGVRAALKIGAAAVLTCDQDSRLQSDYVNSMLKGYRAILRRRTSVGALAAGAQSGEEVKSVYYRDRGHLATPTLDAIQSGMLIPASTFVHVGLFDETLFIDCVDSDFVLRCATRGLPTYLVRGCDLEHSLGRTVRTPIGLRHLTKKSTFAFHPPLRRYYITRNRLVLLTRYGWRYPWWAVRSTAGEMVQLLRSVGGGPEKPQQSAAVVTGLVDALRGRSGKVAVRTQRLFTVRAKRTSRSTT